jgi:hypothetical protein
MALLGHSLEKTSDVDKCMDSFIEFQQKLSMFFGLQNKLETFLEIVATLIKRIQTWNNFKGLKHFSINFPFMDTRKSLANLQTFVVDFYLIHKEPEYIINLV